MSSMRCRRVPTAATVAAPRSAPRATSEVRTMARARQHGWRRLRLHVRVTGTITAGRRRLRRRPEPGPLDRPVAAASDPTGRAAVAAAAEAVATAGGADPCYPPVDSSSSTMSWERLPSSGLPSIWPWCRRVGRGLPSPYRAEERPGDLGGQLLVEVLSSWTSVRDRADRRRCRRRRCIPHQVQRFAGRQGHRVRIVVVAAMTANCLARGRQRINRYPGRSALDQQACRTLLVTRQ